MTMSEAGGPSNPVSKMAVELPLSLARSSSSPSPSDKYDVMFPNVVQQVDDDFHDDGLLLARSAEYASLHSTLPSYFSHNYRLYPLSMFFSVAMYFFYSCLHC